MCIDVGDLADADDDAAGLLELVEQRWGMRGCRQVAPITGTHIVVRCVADERPRYDPTHFVFVYELSCDIAKLVQPFEAKRLLVTRDLKHAIGRRVYDRLAGLYVLVAELGNDRRAGGMTVAEHAGQVSFADKFVKQVLREGIGGFVEIAPIEQHRHAGDFPMTAGRVLATRKLLRITVRPNDIDIGVYSNWKRTAAIPAGMM